jgi:hypothetical protein
MEMPPMLIVGHVLPLMGNVLVLASFAGLGRIVQRTFGEQGAIFEAIALGFAANLIIGGLLNLLPTYELSAQRRLKLLNSPEMG